MLVSVYLFYVYYSFIDIDYLQQFWIVDKKKTQRFFKQNFLFLQNFKHILIAGTKLNWIQKYIY